MNDGTVVKTVLMVVFGLGGALVVLRALVKFLRPFLAILREQMEAAQRAQAAAQETPPPKRRKRKKRGAAEVEAFNQPVEVEHGTMRLVSDSEAPPPPKRAVVDEDRRILGLKERFVWSELVAAPVSLRDPEEDEAASRGW